MPSYIFDAVRSHFGRIGQGVSHVRPDDLAAHALKGLLDRNPECDPTEIDDVFLGAANQAGEDNRNVARMAVLLAGLPTTVPGVTVNRLCSSGLEALVQGARAIESGDARIVVAGGVESMSRAPWVMLKPSKGFPAADATMFSSTLGWRMVNPSMSRQWTIANGASAEILAEKFNISRDAQDAFAARSHALASAAWEEGVFDNEVVQIPGVEITKDDGIRTDTTIEKLAELKAVFKENGSVTAGNSSQLTDGAAMLLVGDEALAAKKEPMVRILAKATVGNDPDIFGIAPVEAANRALAKAGKTWADVDVLELNEAFASQSLACLALWPEVDPEIMNIHGGAIALGHPLGASGARIVGHVAHELVRRGSGVGVAVVCVGVGQGVAVVVER
jgi:acetyl-CoA acetyltransferase family protein